MLQGEHSAILSTIIKLPFVFKVFVFLFFEWTFYGGLLYVKNVCIHVYQDQNYVMLNVICEKIVVMDTHGYMLEVRSVQ